MDRRTVGTENPGSRREVAVSGGSTVFVKTECLESLKNSFSTEVFDLTWRSNIQCFRRMIEPDEHANIPIDFVDI